LAALDLPNSRIFLLPNSRTLCFRFGGLGFLPLWRTWVFATLADLGFAALADLGFAEFSDFLLPLWRNWICRFGGLKFCRFGELGFCRFGGLGFFPL